MHRQTKTFWKPFQLLKNKAPLTLSNVIYFLTYFLKIAKLDVWGRTMVLSEKKCLLYAYISPCREWYIIINNSTPISWPEMNIHPCGTTVEPTHPKQDTRPTFHLSILALTHRQQLLILSLWFGRESNPMNPPTDIHFLLFGPAYLCRHS